jgi:HPt (histidine-containing phosphotransfer) domain-containing protein
MGSIDLSVLDGLKELSGDDNGEFLRTLIDLFLTSTPKKVQKMKEAMGHNDAKTVSFEAHSLKSSAASLGALAVSKIAAEIENETKGSKISAATVAKFAIFEKEYSGVLIEFQNYLATLRPEVKKAA